MIPIIAALAGQGLGLIGNLITGKGIEYATKFVKDKTGIDIGSVIDKPLSNEDALALRKFQVENELELKKLALDETKVYLADIQDARGMQKEALRQVDTFSKRFIYYLSILVIVLVFIFDYMLFFIDYPPANRDMINQVSGILNASALIMILAFFYGSSKSSGDKNDMLHKIMQGKG